MTNPFRKHASGLFANHGGNIDQAMTYSMSLVDTLSGADKAAAMTAVMVLVNAAAAAPTIGVSPPGLDPTSALVALSLSAHGGMFQAMAAAADVVHQMASVNLATNGATYLAVDTAAATGALL